MLCGVSGVQSQSLTVDRQMKRYNVPRLAFINKLDRQGCSPDKIVQQLRKQLKLNAAAVQIPVGLENEHNGVIDIIKNKMYTFHGDKGDNVHTDAVPDQYLEAVNEKRVVLLECLSDVDDEIAELFLSEEIPDEGLFQRAIRRQTIACKFVPVFMGAAYKNKGVQPLLDGVVDYLPMPSEKANHALDRNKNEEPILISAKDEDPLLALAFKLDETQFGQLTYMRIYQGHLAKGKMITNVNDGKKVKLSRIVRMHSDDMEEISYAGAGEVVAMFGIDCRSMDTFSDGPMNLAMSSMYIPEPVMSLAVKPAKTQMQNSFAKAIHKFTKEDPTLRIKLDPDTKETILSGMGELHLEVYIERMLREYNVECVTGKPNVNYKENISKRVDFDYLHKKQTGGAGQYARCIGYIEPVTAEDKEEEPDKVNIFENRCVGTNIPPEYYSSCEKGAIDAFTEGPLVGCAVEGVKVVLLDGAAHSVDSSDQAFRTCMATAVRTTMRQANASILEPVMTVEIDVPAEFQGTVVGGINRRMGLIQNSDMNDDGSSIKLSADVPLANMFGYSTELRSQTQGKGEFSMEYKKHIEVPRSTQELLMKKYKEEKDAENAA